MGIAAILVTYWFSLPIDALMSNLTLISQGASEKIFEKCRQRTTDARCRPTYKLNCELKQQQIFILFLFQLGKISRWRIREPENKTAILNTDVFLKYMYTSIKMRLQFELSLWHRWFLASSVILYETAMSPVDLCSWTDSHFYSVRISSVHFSFSILD